MERMHSVDPDYRDKALVDKVGITPDTKEQVRYAQSNSAVGGNAYFMANEIQYRNDQQRRMQKN